jgi:hypothetical protein
VWFESFFDAGPLHADMHDCWNQLDQPSLGQPTILAGSSRPEYFSNELFSKPWGDAGGKRAPYLLQVRSRGGEIAYSCAEPAASRRSPSNMTYSPLYPAPQRRPIYSCYRSSENGLADLANSSIDR